MLVWMNASPAMIDRSTWLSAARWMTWSGAKVSNASVTALPVANVDLGEAIVRRVVDRRQRLQIAGIGERVEIEHRGAVGHQAPAHGRADESRASGHKHFALHEGP